MNREETQRMNEMKTHRPQDEALLTCLSCRRRLPADAFYHRANGTPEPRCKECRRRQARLRRKLRPLAARHAHGADPSPEAPCHAPARPLIATTARRDERLRLILRALDEVRRRAERQRRRQIDEQFRLETGWDATQLYADPEAENNIHKHTHNENTASTWHASRNED